MPEEIQATVKIPLSEIVTSLRKKHGLPSKLIGARIEGNVLVLNLSEGGQEPPEPPELLNSKEPVGKRNARTLIEEDPMALAEAMSEEPNENEEVTNDEPNENEEARERNRFWRRSGEK